jgi:hypothetical protein
MESVRRCKEAIHAITFDRFGGETLKLDFHTTVAAIHIFFDFFDIKSVFDSALGRHIARVVPFRHSHLGHAIDWFR